MAAARRLRRRRRTNVRLPVNHFKLLHIRNNIGAVDCSLFDAPEGFPGEVLHFTMRLVLMKIRRTEARCDLKDVPSGIYALVVLHDENVNGKLDTNWVRIPKEGYGFSDDAKAVLRDAFLLCRSFVYDGNHLELTIGSRYLAWTLASVPDDLDLAMDPRHMGG